MPGAQYELTIYTVVRTCTPMIYEPLPPPHPHSRNRSWKYVVNFTSNSFLKLNRINARLPRVTTLTTLSVRLRGKFCQQMAQLSAYLWKHDLSAKPSIEYNIMCCIEEEDFPRDSLLSHVLSSHARSPYSSNKFLSLVTDSDSTTCVL